MKKTRFAISVAIILILLILLILRAVAHVGNNTELEKWLINGSRAYIYVMVFVTLLMNIYSSYISPPNKCDRDIFVTSRTEKQIRRYYRANSTQLIELARWWSENDSNIVKIAKSKPSFQSELKLQGLINGYQISSHNGVSEDTIAFCNQMSAILSNGDVKSIEGIRCRRTQALMLRIAFDPKRWAPLKELWFVEEPQTPKSIDGEGVIKQELLSGGWHLVTLEWVPTVE